MTAIQQLKRVPILILFCLLSIEGLGQISWVQRNSMPVAGRYVGVSFVVGNYAYVGTGYNNANQILDDIWEYDPQIDSWTQVASIPKARAAGSAFSFASVGVVGLGTNGSVRYNDFYSYDPGSNSWTQIASLPDQPRYGAASFVAGGVFGYICSGNMGSAAGPYSNQLWELNSGTFLWTQKQDFPGAPRYGIRGVGGGFGFVFGGVDESSGNFIEFDDLWRFDSFSNSWVQMQSFPGSARHYSVIVEFGNSIIVGTGIDANQVITSPMKDFYQYDPINNSWTGLPSLPSSYGLWGAVSFSVSGRTFVATGDTIHGLVSCTNELWELVDATGSNESIVDDIVLFPSPSSGLIRIKLNQHENYCFKLYTVDWKLTFERALNKGIDLIDLSTISNGTYFYSILKENGELVKSDKLLLID